ncbi:MAG TPA: penicillin acylase family protein, partial [Flavisolibacter sp.]
PSDEGSMWFRLNRAQNYNDYLEAIKGFSCPGQNMLFASKTGDIAIWQQARFPARWNGQGLYVMPGEDSSYMWKEFIPQEQNPHVLNPASGFIQSANQRPVDSTYPYFIPGNYIAARGVTIASRLQQLQHAGPSEMMRLQLDYYSSTASMILPFMISNTDVGALGATEREFLDELRRWDFMTTPDSRSTTLYQAWLDSLESRIWMDEFSQLTGPVALPEEQTLVEALLRDSAFRFVDDVRTEQKETVQQQVTAAFRQMASAFSGSDEVPPWAKFKNVSIMHLTGQLEPFSRRGLYAGGWGNTPNAIKVTHGPSWRMIVHLNGTTEAYGVYPGGQSGNPGSPFYDNGIDMWLAGRYYVLWMMKPGEATDKRIRGTITFKKA